MTDYGKIVVRGGEFYSPEGFIQQKRHDLFKIIMSQTADPELVVSLLNVDSVRNRLFGEYPVLHEAVEQASHYAGARCILETAWNDPQLRPLFDNLDYIDKYGRTVFRRMKESRIPKKEDLDEEIYKAWENLQTPPPPPPEPEYCTLF
jgi:hypothetical protein